MAAPAGRRGHSLHPLREIIDAVLNAFGRLRSLVLVLSVAAPGCLAQTPVPAAAPPAGPQPMGLMDSQTGGKLSPELTRRIEVMIRSRSGVPPQYVISIGERRKSEVPGFDRFDVTFSAEGNTSPPTPFLVSADGKTLAQFNKFDIAADPKDKVSGAGRPARGGPENAPVLIVGFDDLECPFCKEMHAELFPAIVERYKSQVRLVYLDFPLTELHPWAMRAAVDANCLAASTPAGYWDYVDYVHAHSAEFGGEEHSVAKAGSELDKLAEDEGGRQKVNAADLDACVKKQDETRIRASMKTAEDLKLEGAPALFINGEKVDGVTAIENIYRMVDEALTAAGQTPPPPYKAPPKPAATPAPAAKPGS
jgi:protein-disulfide isomerase